MRTLLSLALIALAGCASQPRQQVAPWYKAGATEADFEIDHGQCSAQAFAVTNPTLLQVALVQNSCMRGKGWRRGQ